MITRNLPAIIALIYLAAALTIPLIGVWKKKIGFSIAISTTLIAAALSAYGFAHVLLNGTINYFFGGWIPPIGIEYVYDPLSSFVSLVINIVALIVLAHSYRVVDIDVEGRQIPYYAVVMLLLFGFNGMIITGDLFNLYVFIEISSLSGYALIAVGEKRSAFAAFRYLIIGTLGASFYLLGIGYLYFISGTLNMNDLASILPLLRDSPTIRVALILIVVGLGIKMALFPMHGWLPDSYTYAPTTSSALIAPLGTKVAAYALLRILFFVFGLDYFSRELPVADLIGVSFMRRNYFRVCHGNCPERNEANACIQQCCTDRLYRTGYRTGESIWIHRCSTSPAESRFYESLLISCGRKPENKSKAYEYRFIR